MSSPISAAEPRTSPPMVFIAGFACYRLATNIATMIFADPAITLFKYMADMPLSATLDGLTVGAIPAVPTLG